MTTCDEARSELDRARRRSEHEREVLSGYQDDQRGLESDHRDASRRVDDASSAVVQNERDWESEREALRRALDAERAAEEKHSYWKEQERRLDAGDRTDYSGETNERAIIRGGRETASNNEYDAEQTRKGAEDDVRTAKDRFDRSKEFLQERADSKFAIEDKLSTLRNRIDLQQSAVSDANEWARNAERTVDQVC